MGIFWKPNFMTDSPKFEVIRLLLRIVIRGKLPPNEFAIRKCCLCQSKIKIVKIIFLRIINGNVV
jgi:hypothetical protein